MREECRKGEIYIAYEELGSCVLDWSGTTVRILPGRGGHLDDCFDIIIGGLSWGTRRLWVNGSWTRNEGLLDISPVRGRLSMMHEENTPFALNPYIGTNCSD